MEFVKINNVPNLLSELQAAVKKQLEAKTISEADIIKFIKLVNNTFKLKQVVKLL